VSTTADVQDVHIFAVSDETLKLLENYRLTGRFED